MLVCIFFLHVHAVAEEIVMGISFSIPPYIIKNSGTGIELDILNEAFKFKKHKVKPKFLPLARTFLQFDHDEIDGVINVKKGLLKKGYYSDVVIHFQNCAISLAKKKYPVHGLSIRALSDKNVVAFQRASFLLGEEFERMTHSNSQYSETAKQVQQIKLLFSDRTDLVIMDTKIFGYYKRQVKNEIYLNPDAFKQIDINQDVVFHYMFPPTKYRFAFRKKTIRDDFNAGLKNIKKNGVYGQIMNKYKSESE